ncbi:hypothetical protein MJA45_25125 [Paenibacillus aurantius]|uniref:Uncharacterized protein n=1 Tax=Paenibacillus aurantius TaxID=2918900 RepID=A0AA96LCX1_9BACL|nr:hypothetical protein [Paenibacillus aurantius]WNQ10864.1 hypothetical protein MJA45_25125 [Paenibacillus aurantius]
MGCDDGIRVRDLALGLFREEAYMGYILLGKLCLFGKALNQANNKKAGMTTMSPGTFLELF